MMYAITLIYAQPALVEAHLDAHRQWLTDEVRAGRILAAGPLASGMGGFVLAHAGDLGEIDAMIMRDPFHAHGVVRFTTEAFQVALRASAFPAQWCGEARAVA